MAKKMEPEQIIKFVCPTCDAHTTKTVGELRELRAASPTYTPICEVDQHPLRIVGEGEVPAPAASAAKSPADEHEFVLGVLERHVTVMERKADVAGLKLELKDANGELTDAQDALNTYISRYVNPVSTPLLDGVESMDLDEGDGYDAAAPA